MPPVIFPLQPPLQPPRPTPPLQPPLQLRQSALPSPPTADQQARIVTDGEDALVFARPRFPPPIFFENPAERHYRHDYRQCHRQLDRTWTEGGWVFFVIFGKNLGTKDHANPCSEVSTRGRFKAGPEEIFVQQQQIQAGVILSAIGSLTQANLRFAARSQTTTLPGPLELISLDGTLSPDGLHLHGTVADEHGHPMAGHIGQGCIVRTTAEIAIASLPHLIFSSHRRSQNRIPGTLR